MELLLPRGHPHRGGPLILQNSAISEATKVKPMGWHSERNASAAVLFVFFFWGGDRGGGGNGAGGGGEGERMPALFRRISLAR